jgi:hypothetical protein
MPNAFGGRRRRLGILLVLLAVGLAALLAVAAAALRGGTTEAAPTTGLASKVVATESQCEAYTDTPANKTNGVSDEACLARAAYTLIGKSDDPAALLPQVDAVVAKHGGFLGSMCHLVMHRVGRQYAEDHGVTLTNLLDFLPRSNSPNCSAGFAHGMIATLGAAVAAAGPRAAAVCERSETREEEYTCIHGLGHAFMRNYSEQIPYALKGCDSLGRRFAPDCGMGVFHDYWLSVSGLDDTQRPRDVELDPRKLCADQPSRFVRVCWYPSYLVRSPATPLGGAPDVARLCSGLEGLQRFGCITAGIVAASEPSARQQLASCSYFRGADVAACVRSVGAETYAKKPLASQVGLLDACTRFRSAGERASCFSWLAKSLTVATNGGFATQGCAKVVREGRAACRAGAEAWKQPLETFT